MTIFFKMPGVLPRGLATPSDDDFIPQKRAALKTNATGTHLQIGKLASIYGL